MFKKKIINRNVNKAMKTKLDQKTIIMMKNETNLSKQDPEIAQLIHNEDLRQQHGIELIASENYVSSAVLEAQGSILTNKYAEGYPGKRYYGGCHVVDEVEKLAIRRLCKLFNTEYANVQPNSGSQANQAVYAALMSKGDVLLGMSLDAGGHLTHGSSVSTSGMFYESFGYGVTPTGEIDYDMVEQLALNHRPKVIVAGFSAYSGLIDWGRFRKIADSVDAYLMADIAHVAGLVCTGLYPSPVGYADVITSTTHKTLGGPRGGVIMTNDKHISSLIDKAIFPGLQGGPLMHTIAAKAVAFGEALQPDFKMYQQRVIDNAASMAQVFDENGIKVVGGGTSNHLMVIDCGDQTGREVESRLEEIGITVNKNTIPNDTRSPFVTSGIRIGTPAITRRGFTEAECRKIASIISKVIKVKDWGCFSEKSDLISQVHRICANHL